MPIDFSPERWDKIKRTYGQWWDGTLDRPTISVQILGRDPGRAQPQAPLLSQSTCMDLSISPRDIVDRIDYELSKITYLGDAFPYFNLDCFGPGVAAAFCGAKMDNSTGRVWFFPEKVLPISELHFEYDENNVWLNRVKEICQEAMEHWQGQVLMGMVDMGGILDILSSFRTTENLLMDLYDEPDEVERLVWELHGLWHRFYDDINEVLMPVNPGYCDWSGIYSSSLSYILQSDFCYMISPQMFDKFVKPELDATCKRLPHTIYHLDGMGELPHLDSLLEIKELDCVQWQPGEGKPDQAHWPEVYQKITNAGKKMQVFHNFESLDAVVEQTGSRKGINYKSYQQNANLDTVLKLLKKYGAE
jgi:hypothetical protein